MLRMSRSKTLLLHPKDFLRSSTIPESPQALNRLDLFCSSLAQRHTILLPYYYLRSEAMPGAPMAESPSSSSAAWCVFYGVGIICTLVVYGILQEGIMTVAYDGTLFRYSVFLVLCNRLAAVAFAVAMAIAKGESMKNEAPLWKYLIVSLSNVYASSCQYEALKYVSFAVQMLGKSFKMMPVMVWGMIISGKSYSARDWMVALSVTLGCTEFLMTGPTHSKVDANNSFKGFLLLGGFLALDGLTSTFQEKLFKEHQDDQVQPDAVHQSAFRQRIHGHPLGHW